MGTFDTPSVSSARNEKTLTWSAWFGIELDDIERDAFLFGASARRISNRRIILILYFTVLGKVDHFRKLAFFFFLLQNSFPSNISLSNISPKWPYISYLTSFVLSKASTDLFLQWKQSMLDSFFFESQRPLLNFFYSMTPFPHLPVVIIGHLPKEKSLE